MRKQDKLSQSNRNIEHIRVHARGISNGSSESDLEQNKDDNLPNLAEAPSMNATEKVFKDLKEDSVNLTENKQDDTTDNNIDIKTLDHFSHFDNLPSPLLFVDDQTSKLSTLSKFNELSEYLIKHASNSKTKHKAIDSEVLDKIVGFPIKNTVHYMKMGSYLKQMYEDKELMDVLLEVDGNTFAAHRIILSMYSEFFAEIFSVHIGKKIPFQLKINGVSAEALAAFLEFCYTGEMKLKPQTAEDMYILADVFRVPKIEEFSRQMLDKIPVNRLMQLIKVNQAAGPNLYYQYALKRSIINFQKTSLVPEFLDIDFDTILILVASDELAVTSEYEVFQAVIRWIFHDMETRLQYAMRLMNRIRFCFMTHDELVSCSETTHYLRNYDKFREMILIACWQKSAYMICREDPFRFPMPTPRISYKDQYKNLPQLPEIQPTNAIQKEDTDDFQFGPPLMTSTPKAKPEPRQSDVQTPVTSQQSFPSRELPPGYILAVGGFFTEDLPQNSRFIECYDIRGNKWQRLTEPPDPRRHHAVISYGDFLYVIGGYHESLDDNPEPSSSVLRMDLANNTWDEVKSMAEARMNHCACVLDGIIYVIGGKGERNKILATVESFSPETNTWRRVSSLLTPRYAAMVTIFDGMIIVAGGLGMHSASSGSLLTSVELYSPDEDCWMPINDLRIPRCFGSMVNVGGRLFICGGATRSFERDSKNLVSVASVDEFDEENDKWQYLSEMMIARHDAGIAVAGSLIFIIGGVSSTLGRVLQSVECYDTLDGTWLTNLADLPEPTRGGRCAVVQSKFKL